MLERKKKLNEPGASLFKPTRRGFLGYLGAGAAAAAVPIVAKGQGPMSIEKIDIWGDYIRLMNKGRVIARLGVDSIEITEDSWIMTLEPWHVERNDAYTGLLISLWVRLKDDRVVELKNLPSKFNGPPVHVISGDELKVKYTLFDNPGSDLAKHCWRFVPDREARRSQASAVASCSDSKTTDRRH
jgi:hypothetical protein